MTDHDTKVQDLSKKKKKQLEIFWSINDRKKNYRCITKKIILDKDHWSGYLIITQKIIV